MMATDIFVKGASPEQGLLEFSKEVAEILALDELSERESSNYADGHYFTGILKGSKVWVYYLDTEGLEQYQFAINIDPCDAARAAEAANALAASGFLSFVPSGAWYKTSWNGEGTRYEF